MTGPRSHNCTKIFDDKKCRQISKRVLKPETELICNMSDEWFEGKIATADAPEDGCHPDEAKALQDYYHKKVTAQEAAQALTRPIESSENPYDNLYRLWGLLIDALVELPETEISNLVQLLDAIQRLPNPNLTERQTGNASSEGSFWRGLPRFGHMWADEHKQDHWRDTLSTKDPAKRAIQRAKHIRKARVEAGLTVANVGGIPLDWGYDCIADALECRNAVLDFEIPAAAEWIAVAGNRLLAGAIDGRESWALERRRDFQKEEAKMSKDRWSFWLKRMEELFVQSEIAMVAAQAAGQGMEALTTGSV